MRRARITGNPAVLKTAAERLGGSSPPPSATHITDPRRLAYLSGILLAMTGSNPLHTLVTCSLEIAGWLGPHKSGQEFTELSNAK